MKLKKSDEELEAILEYQRLLREKADLETAFEKAKRRLVEIAAVKGQKSISATSGTSKVVATISSRTTTQFNEPGLKKALGAVSYKRLCKMSIDRAKLEEAVKDQKVDPVVVAQYTVIKQSAPYITLSERHVEDDG